MQYCYLEQGDRNNLYEVCTYPLEYSPLFLPLIVFLIVVYTIYSGRKQRLDNVLRKCEEVLKDVN
jgi:hypothetical protein